MMIVCGCLLLIVYLLYYKCIKAPSKKINTGSPKGQELQHSSHHDGFDKLDDDEEEHKSNRRIN